ncbi:MAG TPA: ABC transporter permease [Rhizomicrobium sp.]|jgi:ABC-2 type transport system permease protein|nr:ABC transporter permease [Rhizomicrobium sp.]
MNIISMLRHFSLARFYAILNKEFIQMRRDRLTFGMIIGIPVLQLILFGYAINLNPKHLPTAISVEDPGVLARSIVVALKNTDYFNIVKTAGTAAEARRLLNENKVAFVVEIPVDFTRKLVRGEDPQILVEADATDPSAGSYAIAALNQLAQTALRDDLKGPLAARAPPAQSGFEVVVHSLYNPEAISQYNIVPGIAGMIVTMTMVLITAMAVTRERERGTYENLLAMPATPLEIMLGKISTYIVVGYLQVAMIFLMAWGLFHVPMLGSLALLSGALVLFIIVNLSIGYSFSTIAQNQLQAMQMTIFFFLPSILLSGFMFPFDGMPSWARALGECLPLTHFLRIIRGILLKANGPSEIWPDIWPLILFMLATGTLALSRFRRTLD